VQQYSRRSPESVFLQFRFPLLHFEWYIRNPHYEIERLRPSGGIRLKVEWRAVSLQRGAGEAPLNLTPLLDI
jgi:hypothetical protein